MHLAMPQKDVFADDQNKTTASVLVQTRAGHTLEPEQVQAIVHLVASSVEGLDADAGHRGRRDRQGALRRRRHAAATGGDARSQQIEDFENRLNAAVQKMLDRVVGPGTGRADHRRPGLRPDRDEYHALHRGPRRAALSESPSRPRGVQRHRRRRPAACSARTTSMVPNGTTGGTIGQYENSDTVRDNAVDKITEPREEAPGSVKTPQRRRRCWTPARAAPSTRRRAAPGRRGRSASTPTRGDTIAVTAMPFDRTPPSGRRRSWPPPGRPRSRPRR